MIWFYNLKTYFIYMRKQSDRLNLNSEVLSIANCLSSTLKAIKLWGEEKWLEELTSKYILNILPQGEFQPTCLGLNT